MKDNHKTTMIFTPNTKSSLEIIAEKMILEKTDVTPYKKVGFLVRKSSTAFTKRYNEKVIFLGEIEVNLEKFILFMR